MKKLISCLAVMFLIAPVFSQDGAKDEGDKHDEKQVTQHIYTEEIIEDFESSEYTTEKNLKYIISNQQDGDLQIRDQFPAQYNNSKKYLGVKVFGKRGDVYKIIPAKTFEIKKYCKEISVWVYGKNFSGELQFVVQDVNGDVHNISFGKLTFNGWKKLSASVNKKIKQQNEYLEQEKSFQIIYILYKPNNDTQIPLLQYFYLDDITATVRDKYKDNQTDAWGKEIPSSGKDKKEGEQK